YLTALKTQGVEVDDEGFKATLRYFVVFRLLQVLGAYGFRGRFEKKQHFIESISPALASLAELLCSDEISGEFPELQRLIKILHEREMAKTEPDHLVVTVGSFPIRKGCLRMNRVTEAAMCLIAGRSITPDVMTNTRSLQDMINLS
ncbi:MAG: hypothetical protein K2M80_05115, partial [Muribaculaceae bacterium]|nr:hypothetical protein [Muribaculaceae bacterium]